jgi:phosphoribosyl 1,2-cyclic phosphate phosphodiesterase
VAFEAGESRVVVDTGPDFRAQMLREGVSTLDAVVYTHEHKDHLAGMDDVRPFNYLQRRAMTLHASERVELALRRDFHYAFDERKHGGVPDIELARVEDHVPFEAGDMTWHPLPVLHGELPIHGYRVEDVAYITDANKLPDTTMKDLKGLEVLVLNALHPAPHYSHFSLSEAMDVAREVGARRTYFTHVSHLMGYHEEAGRQLPDGMKFAYDGLALVRTDKGWVEQESEWLRNMDLR